MKKILCLALPLLASASFAQIRGTVLNDLLNKNQVSVFDAAAAMVIADAIGLDAQAIIREVRPYGVTIWETAPAWILYHESGRPFSTIWGYKKKGKGWGVIAKEIGMHPGTFNKMRKNGSFDVYCHHTVFVHHGLTDSSIDRWYSRGMRDSDLVVGLVAANGNQSRFDTVMSGRARSGSFDIPGHGKVKGSELKSNGKGSGKSVTNGSGKSKSLSSSKSVGKGSIKTKSQGGGKSVGKGSGKAKGQGAGKGAGKGGGKGKG